MNLIGYDNLMTTSENDKNDRAVKISVQNYKSLRTFLNEYVALNKSKNTAWSIAQWARVLGLEATTSITMILNGQRNCGPKVAQAIANYFSFNEDELTHFKMLVEKDKVSAEDPLHRLIDKQLSVSKNANSVVILSDEQIQKMNRWYFYAIRQLARLTAVKKCEETLRRILNHNKDQDVQFVHALDILEEQGFLKKNDQQNYVASDVILDTSKNISSEAIKVYHEDMGTLAVKSVRNCEVAKRNFQSCTITFSQNKMAEADKLIEKFINEFEALSDSPTGDSVYQMNVQFFPLAVVDEKQV